MPPRIATANDGPSLLDSYWAIPKFTRFLATGAVATAAATKFGLVHPYVLLLLWPKVVGQLQVRGGMECGVWSGRKRKEGEETEASKVAHRSPDRNRKKNLNLFFNLLNSTPPHRHQLWRLVTSFLFLGTLSFPWLLQMVWLVQYGKALEQGVFASSASAADFPFMLFVGCAAMAALSAVPLLPFNVGAMGPALTFMLLYVWSRHNPDQPTSVMGLVTVRSFHLPFAICLASLCGVGGSLTADLLGLVAGHVYYFLKVVHPAGGGARLLETPAWFERALLRLEVISPGSARPGVTAAAAAAAGANPSDPRFRAFAGAGRRLAD